MIHINLFEQTSIHAARRPSPGFAMSQVKLAEHVPLFVLGGGLAIAAGMVWIWGMLLMKGRDDLDARIKTATIEQVRLEPVLQRAAALQGKRGEVKRRIDVITDLESMSDLPVHLLQLLSESLAKSVWLEEVTATGALVAIHGKAETSLAVANYLRELEESQHFADVSLGQLRNDAASGQTTFDVTMTYRPRGRIAVASGPRRGGATVAIPTEVRIALREKACELAIGSSDLVKHHAARPGRIAPRPGQGPLMH